MGSIVVMELLNLSLHGPMTRLAPRSMFSNRDTSSREWTFKVKSRKVSQDVQSAKSGNSRQAWVKCCSQHVEHMQVPNGTGPGVQRSECPLLACYIRHKCSMETSRNSVKGQVR